MRRLILITLLFLSILPILSVSGAFAQVGCIDDGVCSVTEKQNSCNDCSFGLTCVNDNICTADEKLFGCLDCAYTVEEIEVAKNNASGQNMCVADGECTLFEKELGNCADCQNTEEQKSDYTGLLIWGAGVGFFGFFLLGAIIVIMLTVLIVSFFAYRAGGKRRKVRL